MNESSEAFSKFWKGWHSMAPVELRDAGEPTAIEIWSHAWQEAVRLEREAIAVEWERDHGFDRDGVAAAIRARGAGQGD